VQDHSNRLNSAPNRAQIWWFRPGDRAREFDCQFMRHAGAHNFGWNRRGKDDFDSYLVPVRHDAHVLDLRGAAGSLRHHGRRRQHYQARKFDNGLHFSPKPESRSQRSQRRCRYFSTGLASTAAALVALVAINAVVDIAAHALMVLIGGRLGVAVRALEDCVVAGTGVARRADAIRTPVVGGEPGVVEGCACPPGHYLVAGLAGGWKSGRYVIGIVRGLVLNFVTRIAIRWERSVVVVHVAARARDASVGTDQRENRIVVIERGRLPCGRAVTNVALLRKSSGNVIRIGGALIVGHVAAHTGRSRQVVVSTLVAIRTLQLQVPTRQREAALGMIERGRLPSGRAVAD